MATRQSTIVALYGDGKPAALRELVTDLQDGIVDAVGEHFAPRPVHDVHLTIVGLEIDHDAIDVVGLCRHLVRELTADPLAVRFGGVTDGDPRTDGRGRRLHERALVVAGPKVVLIGWPVGRDDEPTGRLDDLRRAAGRFGARHRYHATPAARDPDAYSVLGDLRPGGDTRRLDDGLRAGRSALARSCCRVRVAAADVRLATYLDPRLPGGSTISTPIAEVTP